MLLNSNLVTGAFQQLVRDVKFLLALLPDIPAQYINIKALVAFPETSASTLFCKDCSQFILSKEDFEENSEYLKLKLSIENPVLDKENENLFLTAVARLIGKESEEFPPKAINNFVVNFEETVDTLIFLDEKQMSILRTLDENKETKNFGLKGPSGSGKTIIGIKIVNKLIDRYFDDGYKKVFVYAVIFDAYYNSRDTGEMHLTTFIEKNIINQNLENIVCTYKKYSEILKAMNIKRNFGNTSHEIQLLCQAIQKKHGKNPVILFIDECESDFRDTTRGD